MIRSKKRIGDAVRSSASDLESTKAAVPGGPSAFPLRGSPLPLRTQQPSLSQILRDSLPATPYPFLGLKPQNHDRDGWCQWGACPGEEETFRNTNSLNTQKNSTVCRNLKCLLITQCPGSCGKFLRSLGGPVGDRTRLLITLLVHDYAMWGMLTKVEAKDIVATHHA